MTEVSVSFNDSTLAILRDISARHSQDLNQCVVEIVEKHISEQEELDKIEKVKNNFQKLDNNTRADISSALLSSKTANERDFLKNKADITAYFMKLREKTSFSLGKVTWNEEDLYD